MKKKGRTAGEKEERKRRKRGRGKMEGRGKKGKRRGGEVGRRASRFERTLFIFKFQMKLSCM